MNRFIDGTHCIMINSFEELTEFLDIADDNGLMWVGDMPPHAIKDVISMRNFPISIYYRSRYGMIYDVWAGTHGRHPLIVDDLNNGLHSGVSPVPLNLSFLIE